MCNWQFLSILYVPYGCKDSLLVSLSISFCPASSHIRLLSSVVNPFTFRRCFIPTACIIYFKLLVNTQDSLPHTNYYFSLPLCILFFYKTIMQIVGHAYLILFTLYWVFWLPSIWFAPLVNFCLVYSGI